MKSNHPIRQAGSAVALGAALLFVAHGASAQCTGGNLNGTLDPTCPNDVGWPMCFHKPFDPPGAFGGMPEWPASGVDLPALGAPKNTSSVRDEISDPRWSGSPLRNLFVADPGDRNDRVRFRVVANSDTAPTELAVSIQVMALPQFPAAGDDYIYFGYAKDNGPTNNGAARGLRIALNQVDTGLHREVPRLALTEYTFSGGTGSWNGVDLANDPTYPYPAWIKGGKIHQWTEIVNAAKYSNSAADTAKKLDEQQRADAQFNVDGAVIAVEFKIDLQSPAFQFASNEKLKISVGANLNIGNVGVASYFTPNTARCKGGVACPIANSGTATVSPFIAATAQWNPVEQLGKPCGGISFTRQDIKTPLKCGASNEIDNCVDPRPSQDATHLTQNTFSVTADFSTWWKDRKANNLNNNFVGLNGGDIETTFRMSNWGSIADPAQWLTLTKNSADPAISASTADDLVGARSISQTCSNSTTGINVCNQAIQNKNTNNQAIHQCLLVEMSATPAGTTNGVKFANASAYQNTHFIPASLINETVQINVKGITSATPGANRDVYLHMVTRNMPEWSNAAVPTLDVDALEALRAQTDPTFQKTGITCNQYQRCLPTSGNKGQCAYRYIPNTEFGCTQTVTVDNVAYCTPTSSSPVCTLPAGGGWDPNQTSLTASQKLEGTYPTVMVYPYYDSGKTKVVNGVTKKVLVPMPSFGIHSWHRNQYFGWTQDLTDLNGNRLPEVYPNVFLVSVDKTKGYQDIKLRVEAKEQARATNLFHIAGTATPLGLALGNATITALANTRTLDLSRSTVTINSLLNNSGKELVTSMTGPITLTRDAGATKTAATYSRVGFPSVTMQVTTLPLIGQVITMQVFLADVTTPASCFLGLIGTAPVTTSFTIGDGLGAPVTVQGTDTWTCLPGQMVSFF